MLKFLQVFLVAEIKILILRGFGSHVSACMFFGWKCSFLRKRKITKGEKGTGCIFIVLNFLYCLGLYGW